LVNCTASYSCIQDLSASGVGNIYCDPLFSDPNSSDYHLASNSPCIDAGDNSAVNAGDVDIDGDDRIINGGISPTVDIGADEYSPN
jgi:hypothetical protein